MPVQIQEQVFLESMKNLVKGQLHLMSEIATIQDQVVTIIHNHDELQQWGRTGGLQHVFSPHFFKLSKETQAFFCLFLFLLFQILLQLLFHGHFKHLTAHLPGFLQTLLK
ncbi:hypothetical protein ACOMHN_012453 [Nucella lapillus]